MSLKTAIINPGQQISNNSLVMSVSGHHQNTKPANMTSGGRMPKTILFGRLAAASIIAESSSAIRPRKPSTNVEELRRIQLAREEEKEEQHTVAMLKRDEVYFEKGRGSQTTQAKVIADLLLPKCCAVIDSQVQKMIAAPGKAWQNAIAFDHFLKYFEPEELVFSTFQVIAESLPPFLDGYSKDTDIKIARTLLTLLEGEIQIRHMQRKYPAFYKKVYEPKYLKSAVKRRTNKQYAAKRFLIRNDDEVAVLNEQVGLQFCCYMIKVLCRPIFAESPEGLFVVEVPAITDPSVGRLKKRQSPPKRLRRTELCKQLLPHLVDPQYRFGRSMLPMWCPPLEWSITDGKTNRGGTLRPIPGNQGKLIHNNYFGSSVEQFHLDALNHLAQFPFRINPFLLACYQEIWDRDIWLDGLGGIYHYAADYSKQVLEQYPNPKDFEEGSEERYEARHKREQWYTKSKEQEKKAVPFRLALKQMKEDSGRPIWMTWFFDTRGRMNVNQYVGACLQGANYQKAVLDSDCDAPITDQTWKDLLIHIANTAGFKTDSGLKSDKLADDLKIEWAAKHVQEPQIQEIIDNPIGSMAQWEKASEPWSYIRALKEYSDIFIQKVKTTTNLFVGLDATNSALQILGGLTADERTCQCTNVVVTEAPQDLYQVIVTAMIAKLTNPEWVRKLKEKEIKKVEKAYKKREEDNQIETPDLVLGFDPMILNRSVVKKAVMTHYYSATDQTKRESMLDELDEQFDLEVRQQDKQLLIKAMTQAMAEEFPGPVGIHELLKDVAKVQSGKDQPATWITPSGMKVVNEYHKTENIQIRTHTMGGMNMEDFRSTMSRDNSTSQTAGGLKNGALDKQKMVNAICPNFIHSLDASILHKALNSVPKDVPLFTVHDCAYFLTGYSQEILPHLRRAFHDVITSRPLEGLLEENQVEDELSIPPRGDADVDQSLISPYLFC